MVVEKNIQYKKSLFIFRRDLRLEDNTSLNLALEKSETVIPCFIFDPRQVGSENEYRSLNAIQFMIESLHELNSALEKQGSRLYIFQGNPATIVDYLIKHEQIDALFLNRDYTPFSMARDADIEKMTRKYSVAFLSYDDALLHAPTSILNTNGKPYVIFSAFYKKALSLDIASPHKKSQGAFYTNKIASTLKLTTIENQLISKKNTHLALHGGMHEAQKILRNISSLKSYSKHRDIPSIETSHLSAYLKFGCISVRAVYHKIAQVLGHSHPLIAQLHWRDFFTHIAFHFPEVFGHAFRPQYDKISWTHNEKLFTAWCSGTTGFPIVDAGMRQLNQTGFMHNRVRMIVASFLVKDLQIDWRKGEQYFAQQLIDYDPAVNNGNWQWCASTGCDAQPYFRIFNPWLQQKKFDPECIYIKRWVPELKNVNIRIIHAWHKEYKFQTTKYPGPLIDHTSQAASSKQLFRSYAQKRK